MNTWYCLVTGLGLPVKYFGGEPMNCFQFIGCGNGFVYCMTWLLT